MAPELYHADSVVVLCGFDLCVYLPLTILPAQLASFRQKRAKSDSAGAPKKTQKRKGQNVSQVDGAAQDSHVEPADLSTKATDTNIKTHQKVYYWLYRYYHQCIKIAEKTELI